MTGVGWGANAGCDVLAPHKVKPIVNGDDTEFQDKIRKFAKVYKRFTICAELKGAQG